MAPSEQVIYYLLSTFIDFDLDLELGNIRMCGSSGHVSSSPRSRDLQRVTQEKLEVQNQVASLSLEMESVKTSSEQLSQEKWELTQAGVILCTRKWLFIEQKLLEIIP